MPLSPTTGGFILQAAQSIIAQNQQHRALELKEKEFAETKKRQDQLMQLREKELQAKESAIQVQQQQAEFTAKLQPGKEAQQKAKLQQTQAETLKTLMSLTPQGAEVKPLTPAQKRSIAALRETIRKRAVDIGLLRSANRLEMSLPAGASFESLQKERSRLVNALKDSNLFALVGKGLPPELQEAKNKIASIDRLFNDQEFRDLVAASTMGALPEKDMAEATQAVLGGALQLDPTSAARLGTRIMADTDTTGPTRMRVFGQRSNQNIVDLANSALRGDVDELRGTIEQHVFKGGKFDAEEWVNILAIMEDLGVPFEDLRKISTSIQQEFGVR